MGGNHGDDPHHYPLTDSQRTGVIVVHFMVFVVGGVSLWAFLYKYDVLRNRIWSPFLLLMGLVFFQIGGAFEIGNHYYEGDWELAGFPSDLINGCFYFFNFGATYLNALGMRKKGVPLLRNPCAAGGGFRACALHTVAMLFDLVLVVGFVLTGPLYATAGRGDAVGILSAFSAIGGFATLFRIWQNLGPNCGTLFGGLGWWIMIICGVVLTNVYMSTGYEWLHAVLGSFFVFCLIPITVGILCATETIEETSTTLVESNVENDTKSHHDLEEGKANNNTDGTDEKTSKSAMVETDSDN